MFKNCVEKILRLAALGNHRYHGVLIPQQNARLSVFSVCTEGAV